MNAYPNVELKYTMRLITMPAGVHEKHQKGKKDLYYSCGLKSSPEILHRSRLFPSIAWNDRDIASRRNRALPVSVFLRNRNRKKLLRRPVLLSPTAGFTPFPDTTKQERVSGNGWTRGRAARSR